MSFINMMVSDYWSDLDINRRVQSLIRFQFTAEDELKAARLARQETKTDAEAAFIASVDAAITAALTEGATARSDMALLKDVLHVEDCMRIVALSAIPPALDDQGAVTNQDSIDADVAAKSAAQAVIDAASDPVKSLVAERNPAPTSASP